MILKGTLAFSLTLFVELEIVFASCPRQTYEEDEGRLRSPGFGSSSSYGNNMSCTYDIKVSPGRRITLEFKTLSILGCMPNCPEDSLEIFVGCDAVNGNVSIGKFCSCSTVSVPKILSYDHCMMLVFKSDGSLKGAGFEAVYNSTNNNLTKADPSTNCSESFMEDSSGTVFTPNWPLKYPRDTSCQWSLYLHRSKAARFFFTFLDLEYNFVCKTDAGWLDTDDISISGITTAGHQVFIKERVCVMPDVPYFSVKNMTSVLLKFRANKNKEVGAGAVIGYVSYKDGTLNSDLPGCRDIGAFSTKPTSTLSTKPFSTLSTKPSSTLSTKPTVSSTFTVGEESSRGTVICSNAVVITVLFLFLLLSAPYCNGLSRGAPAQG